MQSEINRGGHKKKIKRNNAWKFSNKYFYASKLLLKPKKGVEK